MTITPRDACGQRRSPLTTVPPAPVGAAAASVGAAQAGSEEKTCTILALRRLDAGHDAPGVLAILDVAQHHATR